MGKLIEIQTFFGIGDALFVTPTLQRIKEAYPETTIVVNTHWLTIFEENPYLDVIGSKKNGVRLSYIDPAAHDRRKVTPDCHNIVADWRIVKRHYNLDIEPPELKPQVFFRFDRKHGGGDIGVQVIHKDLYYGKKAWPFCNRLAEEPGFRPIPHCTNLRELASFLTSCSAVVACEGGIVHLCVALGVPCVVVYGGFSRPEWNGYEENINLTHYPECGPCFNMRPCVKGDKPCMTAITIEEVAEAAKLKARQL